MRMPGFTAEAATYVTKSHYRLVANKAASGAAEGLVPQRKHTIDCEVVDSITVYGPNWEFEIPIVGCWEINDPEIEWWPF